MVDKAQASNCTLIERGRDIGGRGKGTLIGWSSECKEGKRDEHRLTCNLVMNHFILKKI